jgi:hypothetical protein
VLAIGKGQDTGKGKGKGGDPYGKGKGKGGVAGAYYVHTTREVETQVRAGWR